MHYVDEGSGEVILFVHGTPTWSFVYRDFIRELSGNYRCLAPDHLGFGLSENPENFPGTPEAHARNLSEFVTRLNLDNITLVVHDFGGPIGLGAALQHPNRIKRVVLFNTWLWSTKENESARKIDNLVNGWLGKFLYLNLNVSPRFLLKQGFSNKKHLSKAVHKQYINPFPDKQARKPLLTLAKALVGSSDWYQAQWEQLHKLENKEWLVLWGVKDEFLGPPYLARWKKRLPEAEVKEFTCGHFVQEEQTQPAISAIREFVANKLTRNQ